MDCDDFCNGLCDCADYATDYDDWPDDEDYARDSEDFDCD